MSKQKQEIIPKAERVKRAQTKQVLINKIALTKKDKKLFARLLVRYTG